MIEINFVNQRIRKLLLVQQKTIQLKLNHGVKIVEPKQCEVVRTDLVRAFIKTKTRNRNTIITDIQDTELSS